jgi:abortive infection bacteriophage resistance protein
VRYEGRALTFEQQADRLLELGLVAERDELVRRLRGVGYYRLSAYWYPFRRPDGRFIHGTSLDSIWRRYTFDRRLRLLALDASERVEVCLRTELVYSLAQRQGPFGYEDPDSPQKLSAPEHERLLNEIEVEGRRSREHYIVLFFQLYGSDHARPPYWTITELMTFGTLLTLFRGCPTAVQQELAERFGVADRVLESWLRALNAVRNVCAHHGRLWNRELGYRPMIPRKDGRWHEPIEVSQHRVFGMLTILKYLLDQIAPHSGWSRRLLKLLGEYPQIPRAPMGFPVGWERCPIWTEDSDDAHGAEP